MSYEMHPDLLGWSGHYKPKERHAGHRINTVDDFWINVEIGDCWEWRGGRNKHGYGEFRYEGKMRRAHRFAYVALVGEPPADLVLDHLCRNRGCVNPDHLEPVPSSVNVGRGTTWLPRTFCQRGLHKMAEAAKVSANGKRECHECRKARRNEYEREKRRARAA